MRTVTIALTLICLTALTGCKQHLAATATCGHVESFESEQGRINPALLPLGQVFVVDTTKTPPSAFSIGTVHTDPSMLTTSPKIVFSTTYDSSLDIQFSGKVPSPSTEATLRTLIKKATTLTASGLQRVSMNDALDWLNRTNDRRAKEILDQLKRELNRAGVSGFIVYAALSADDLAFTIAGSSSSSANVSVLQYGNYSVTVTYQCNNVLSMKGPGAPAFIKALPVAFDEGGHLTRDTQSTVDLKDVSFARAVM